MTTEEAIKDIVDYETGATDLEDIEHTIATLKCIQAKAFIQRLPLPEMEAAQDEIEKKVKEHYKSDNIL